MTPLLQFLGEHPLASGLAALFFLGVSGLIYAIATARDGEEGPDGLRLKS